MKRCNYCQHHVIEEARFCPQCGYSSFTIIKTEDPIEKAKKRKLLEKQFLLILITVIFLFMVYLVITPLLRAWIQSMIDSIRYVDYQPNLSDIP